MQHLLRRDVVQRKVDPDLAGVRDPAALARLAADKQEARRALGTEVDVLLKNVQSLWNEVLLSILLPAHGATMRNLPDDRRCSKGSRTTDDVIVL
jgi:hypothetical protein